MDMGGCLHGSVVFFTLQLPQGRCGAMVSTSARNAGDAGSTPVGAPTLFVHRDSMAGVRNPTLLRAMQIALGRFPFAVVLW